MAILADGGGGGSYNYFDKLRAAATNVGNAAKSASKSKSKSPSLGSGISKSIGKAAASAYKSAGSAAKSASSSSNKPKYNSGSGYSSGGYSSGKSNYSSGGSYSGGSSYGSNASGTIAKAPAPKMSQGQFLAQDTTYKGQQAAYKKAIDDYLAQYAAEQQKYNTEYGAAVDKLGLEREEGAVNLKDDFAGRGLLQSGVYADALTDFNTQYDTRMSDMERAKQNYLNDLLTGKNNFQEEQKLLQEKAKQDAINRYMASVGI